jgi:cyclin A
MIFNAKKRKRDNKKIKTDLSIIARRLLFYNSPDLTFASIKNIRKSESSFANLSIIIEKQDFKNHILCSNDIRVNDQKVTNYCHEIFQYMRHCEIYKQPSKNYLEKNQNKINVSMRRVLIDWMVEVAQEYKLKIETLLLSVVFLDRFLSNNETKNLEQSKLQLVGIASIFIASKNEEIYAPHVDDLTYITDNTYHREEILGMEWQILDTLLYETTQPTPYTFIPRILMGNHTSVREIEEKSMILLSTFLAELAVFDYKVATSFLPSLIASSCVLLANFILFTDKAIWTYSLQVFSGNYKPSHLETCSTTIYNILHKYVKNMELTKVNINKSSTKKFWSISTYHNLIHTLQAFEKLPSFIFADNV